MSKNLTLCLALLLSQLFGSVAFGKIIHSEPFSGTTIGEVNDKNDGAISALKFTLDKKHKKDVTTTYIAAMDKCRYYVDEIMSHLTFIDIDIMDISEVRGDTFTVTVVCKALKPSAVEAPRSGLR